MATDPVDYRNRRVERRLEALREIREELERIRVTEAKIAEALGSSRAARQRVEELIRGLSIDDEGVRDIVREELMAVGEDGPPSPAGEGDAPDYGAGFFAQQPRVAPPSQAAAKPARPAPAPPVRTISTRRPSSRATRRTWVVGMGTVVALAAGAIGWAGLRALGSDDERKTLTVGGDSALPLGGPVAAANGVLDPAAKALEPVDSEPEVEAHFFTLLPDGATQRAAVYDSLWAAHSALFKPLFAELERATPDQGVQKSLAAWRAGSMTALQRDLLHSALVQYALREVTDAQLPLDGQVLRNPCRGPSCSALLHLWETRSKEYGLTPMPGNAASDPAALRTVENVLVLRRLQSLHQPREGTGS